VFAIFLPDADERSARLVAARILLALERPLSVREDTVEQSLSIGISVFPTHGGDRVTLLRRAEAAMAQAKRTHRTYAVSSDHDDANRDGLILVGELRRSIEDGAIDLAFQPEVDLASGRVLRVEALARWTSASRGPIPPDRFIPLAERSGLVGPLTRCVLEKAIAQAASWRRAGIELPVAVNLSVQNVLDRSLPFMIDDLLRRHGLPASSLSVELTESVLMTEIENALPTLATLRSLGIDIAIDDFGTGYSSLAYLARLPVDRLKIDRSFVRAMVGDRSAAAIVRAAIDLGHTLAIAVVAEGVEAEAEWHELGHMECDSVQGYLLAKPMPASHVGPWLDRFRRPGDGERPGGAHHLGSQLVRRMAT
jgi:EAL domain-containing protein (putative c-di-GMP-specific phosphodiesterase class I)